MLKQFTKIIPVCICVLMFGCASDPASAPAGTSASETDKKEETGAPATTSNTATPLKVDGATEAAFKSALNAMKNGRDDSALKQFSDLTQKQPNLAAAFVNIGLLHLKHKRYEKAKDSFLQATTVRPNDPIGQTHLGITYRYLGKINEAKTAYDIALQSDPKYAFAHLNAGILYDLYLNDPARALNHYEQYQALTNNSDKTVESWVAELKRRVDGKK